MRLLYCKIQNGLCLWRAFNEPSGHFLQFKLFTLIQTLWLDNTELLPVLLFVVPGDIAHLSELAELQVEDLTILLICELSPTLWHEYLDTGPEILESWTKELCFLNWIHNGHFKF